MNMLARTQTTTICAFYGLLATSYDLTIEDIQVSAVRRDIISAIRACAMEAPPDHEGMSLAHKYSHLSPKSCPTIDRGGP